MAQPTTPATDISPGLIRLLAVSAGLIVANLYYAQTLVGPISAATSLSTEAAGLIVTLTQVGYALGLLFIVPLGDLLENRRLRLRYHLTGLARLQRLSAQLAASARYNRYATSARRRRQIGGDEPMVEYKPTTLTGQ